MRKREGRTMAHNHQAMHVLTIYASIFSEKSMIIILIASFICYMSKKTRRQGDYTDHFLITNVMIADIILTLWSPHQVVLLLWDMLQAEMLSIVNFTLNKAIEYYLTFAMISTDKGFILIN